MEMVPKERRLLRRRDVYDDGRDGHVPEVWVHSINPLRPNGRHTVSRHCAAHVYTDQVPERWPCPHESPIPEGNVTTGPAMSPPPRHLQAPEAAWPLEAAAFMTIPMPSLLLSTSEPRPVLVLPGFTTSDVSTRPLRHLIRQHGHYAHAWKLGQNVGPTERAVSGLRALLRRLNKRHGQPIAVVGWSLEGLYARALAREQSTLISQVITLGSPIRAERRDRSSVQAMCDRVRALHRDDLLQEDVPEAARSPLRVPATSIFTRTDGVVRWQLCLDATGPSARNPRVENIEVYGTHSGLGVNLLAAFAVLDRLAQPAEGWRPFRTSAALIPFYPCPPLNGFVGTRSFVHVKHDPLLVPTTNCLSGRTIRPSSRRNDRAPGARRAAVRRLRTRRGGRGPAAAREKPTDQANKR